MQKYGFVYIWFDRKHKRYYIGSHWGTENDGYTTGQAWSRNAIKRRKQDFKRRILERVDNREELLKRETYWLSMTKTEELKGVRYYNLHNNPVQHWHTNERSRMKVSEKLSVSIREKWSDPEYRNHLLENNKGLFKEGQIVWNKGISCSEETRQKISNSNTGKPKEKLRGKSLSQEHKEKLRLAKLGNNYKKGKKGQIAWNKGIPHSKEANEKNRQKHLGKIPWNKGISPSEETKQKIRQTLLSKRD